MVQHIRQVQHLGGIVQYVNTTASFTTSTALISNTNYYYFVYSYNSGCTGAPYYSTSSITGSKYTCIAAPTGLTASSISSSSAAISWSASGGTITSYNLLYGTTSGGPYTTVSGVTSPYTLSGLSSNTSYYYEIVANNTANNSTCGTSATSAQSLLQQTVPLIHYLLHKALTVLRYLPAGASKP